jgi:hypothetical protein
MIGSAEQLTEKILDGHAEFSIARIIGQFDRGGLPPACARIHRAARHRDRPAVRVAVSATVT